MTGIGIIMSKTEWKCNNREDRNGSEVAGNAKDIRDQVTATDPEARR